MNYFLAAAVLRAASLNRVTRAAYYAAGNLRQSACHVWVEQGQWILDGLPAARSRLLDLGTGWAHAYSLYPALLRDEDEIHCFDVRDCRRFKSFEHTVAEVARQIGEMDLPAHVATRAAARAKAMMEAASFEDAYRVGGLRYQVMSTGIPQFPDAYFDAIFSIDVLEHVDAGILPAAAQQWLRILKPGGRFMAQVGIDDHLSHYDRSKGPKNYLRYSEATWRRLLGNRMQYINRWTASQLVDALAKAGFAVDEVETHAGGPMSARDVHPDYGWQSDDDIRACRLFVRAHRR
jgi:SAM-dependent methyltransferase